MPATDAAVVAGNPITLRALKHWMYVDAKGQSAQSPGVPVIVPEDPPNFDKCVAQVRAGIPQLKKASTKTIRSECRQLFTSLSGQVFDFLIKGYWYQGTAHKQGITLTQTQLNQAIDKAKKQSGIKTDAQYKQFLASSGYTDADIAFRIRVSTLYQKLLKQHPTKVTDAEIASYYKAHKSSYGSAEKLNMRIVLAKTKANANAAKSALAGGQSWDAVAKKYSIDPTTKDKGGLLSGVTANEEDQALSKAAFAAPANKLEGPVKGQFGYYVFEVSKKIPATQESLKQATPAIKQTLTQQKQTNAAKAVNSLVTSQWKSKTVCAKLWAMADCSNYVKPKTSASASATSPTTTPTPTSGGTTQTAPTQTSKGNSSASGSSQKSSSSSK
ncbi:MAG TPA: peptidyl-prolyl cis-trans isomerase [Solirubrobacteraceae bacterium]|nr:peptidyl-prolyl cis-trans isomerase [Solirubrobacteraceae bacterium]